MSGFPDVDWSLSVPDVVAENLDADPAFEAFRLIPEAQVSGCSDVLITSWGFHRAASQTVVSVAHAVFPAYREMMRATPHHHAVAVSKAAHSVFEAGEEVTTLYNGVDFARLSPTASREATRSRLSLPADAAVVGYVGRWGHQKNPLAAALAASTAPGGIALYVSPDPGEDWLRQARAFGDIRLVTPQEGVPIADLYRAMDVCVVPSRSEGFSLAVAESWFCETPLIATPVGIAAEHPEFVISIPQEPDRTALGAAMAAMGGDGGKPDLATARALVTSTYGIPSMIQGWRRFLDAKLPGLLG